MSDRFSRTRLLVGEEGLERLRGARVMIAGLGGVGGYALEALARAGVGSFALIDSDLIEPSNLNRQILALESSLGTPKVDIARERVAQINPDALVESHQVLLTPDNTGSFVSEDIGHAIDAIDAVPAKTALIRTLHERGVPFVSCMGAGAKLDPSAVRVADISETQGCPLARAVRQRLRKHGIETGIRCVYSDEHRHPAPGDAGDTDPQAPRPQGTIAYLPGIVGLTAAAVIINDLLAS